MSVVLGYDGKSHTEKALRYAIKHALAYGEPLYVVSSVAVTRDSVDRESEIQNVKGYVEAARQMAEDAGADAKSLLEAGHPADVILAAARRVGADTIIVGRLDKTALDRVMIGSVSEKVVRGAHCTVIVVQ
ncbi:MAG: universal stress protein [Candidatus Methanoplasma sp.]|jgi:nucleotide-binding universal stress UspA family protein|nr:universal stress protein [Candidatus Methanoplasma sp.]